MRKYLFLFLLGGLLISCNKVNDSIAKAKELKAKGSKYIVKAKGGKSILPIGGLSAYQALHNNNKIASQDVKVGKESNAQM